MKDAMLAIFAGVQRFSRLSVLITILLFAFFRAIGHDVNLSTQITIALIGLLIGIPHGAIDHLISIPAHPRSRFFAYITIYVLLAVLAGAAIATWNLLGFRVVVIMSALHFGYGDAAFGNEWREIRALPKFSWVIDSVYAIPAGFVPVVLPLTDSRALSALHRIHPTLAHWAGGNTHQIRIFTIALLILSISILAITHRVNFAIDLVMLGTLAVTAPPLVAFAIYFGCWHAARHTVRLILALPRAREFAATGAPRKAIAAAVNPGLYAVAGTLVVATGLMLGNRHHFSSGLLWSTLVVIWSLTVPHMLSTSRLDLRAFSRSTAK